MNDQTLADVAVKDERDPLDLMNDLADDIPREALPLGMFSFHKKIRGLDDEVETSDEIN